MKAEAPIDPAIVEQASLWMARLWSGQASEQDKAACARWLAAHPEHARAWERLNLFDSKLHSVPGNLAGQALREPAASAYLSRRRALRALGVFGVCGGAWALYERQLLPFASGDLHTGTGEVRDMRLADGTQISLASRSAVDVHFDAQQRLIVLRAGEVFISTASDPYQRPLRVQTGQGIVQPVGTRFSVRQDDQATHIGVLEGAVLARPLQAPGAEVRVEAGQAVTLYANRVAASGRARDSDIAWRQGKLVAENLSVADFLAQLGRYRPGLLRCAEQVQGMRVSGVFSLTDTDRALHNLTLALPVELVYRTRYWVTVTARQA